ncbi:MULTISPECIES: hypothetical protein [Paenibacillus]|uniref:Uncharacterized protein n=1 Tax=Paenibacillus oleatilyticus TaxID=2594886 RepID=A0ABV4V767_9BACL|nr:MULTISPECIES: hypothetical protein [Paenibacillus]MBU7317932.1 hypothetical protein [Paenibacillus oleatilyticus]MCM3271936.1 hypothetical protein [Paenibacillus elgii]NEN86245.1 hypothetical protein [Paenibacillus elgii]GLI10053.1 hypothetical protein YDYSG_60860 [Paenibacillus tyrfis]GMX62525.1 hypothetical protein Elgi_23300 [Paenibacillus elgii]
MNCPICHGHGEIESPNFHSGGVSANDEKQTPEYRDALGKKVTICFWCCGNGYVESHE